MTLAPARVNQNALSWIGTHVAGASPALVWAALKALTTFGSMSHAATLAPPMAWAATVKPPMPHAKSA